MVGKYALLVNASMPDVPGEDADVAKPCRQILAANLRTLKDAGPAKLSQATIGEKIGTDQTTVGRILASKHETGIDKLDALARLFKTQPWQLLVPDLVPGRLPEVALFSPRALEVARLFDELSPHLQRLLFAQAQVLHNPDVDPDAMDQVNPAPDVPT